MEHQYFKVGEYEIIEKNNSLSENSNSKILLRCVVLLLLKYSVVRPHKTRQVYNGPWVGTLIAAIRK